jgi:hydrophobe/amphiphile efflux-3 (HAE3) family protein
MKFPSAWVIRFRWPIILIFLAITVAFGTQLPKIDIDPEIKNQLPPDMPARENVRRIEEKFGGSEPVMVVIQAPDVLDAATLERVRAISDELGRLPFVSRVISPFTLTDIRGTPDGMMTVEPAIGDIPTTEADREALRKRLAANDLVFGNVLARDFTAVAVIGMLSNEARDSETVAGVRAAVEKHPGPGEITYGGMPDIRQHVSEDIRSDIRRFAPVGVGVIVVLLYLSLRQIRGVLVPFSVQVMSIVVSMGLLPLLGWKMQMVTVTLPVMILAIGNDHSVHLVSHVQEINTPGNQKSAAELAIETLSELGWPIVAAGITTVAGTMCLLTHIVVPAVQLGWLASWGITFAMLASMLFVPAVLSLLPKAAPLPQSAHGGSSGVLDRLLRWNADFVVSRPKLVLGVVLTVAAVSSAGIPLIEVDTNPVNYYPSSAPVAQNAQMVNRHFGGSTEIAVMVAGDVQDPVVMKKIDALERDLRATEGVGYTLSIAQVVRKMNRAVHGDDPAYDAIPDTREGIAQLFLLYSMGGSPEDFERMVDFEYQHAVLLVRVSSLATSEIKGIVQHVEERVAADFAGQEVVIGGFGTVFSDLVDAVVSGQVSSLALSMVVVAVQDALVFWSIEAGLWSMVPLVVAVPMLFGLMGFSGIELNVVTAMLSSIMIGVGVDYTIHFLWRFREIRRSGVPREDAVRETLTTVGRGVVFNAMSVMAGFSVLFLSNFLPVRFFGFLVVVSIAGCLLAALFLMPPLMLLFKPRFAEPIEKSG